MPSRKKRAMRRQQGSSALPALIAILMVTAAALVILLLQSDPFSEKGAPVQLPPDQQNFIEQRNYTAEPMVIGSSTAAATRAPAETAAPTPQPAAQEQTPAETEEGNRLVPETEEGSWFLPVFDHALRTPSDEMMIAITVDDCDDPQIMEYIVNVARKYDAGLTLFPTGEALMDEKMTKGFRSCVKQYGYQLENHTYNHKGEYRLSDSELALQLWKQSIAASYVLDGDYQQHFFRPVYNSSCFDQRTHFYIRKLGYLGVAGYSHSYWEILEDDLGATLDNGDVYQFDMSEKSISLFEPFIAYASSKGYKLVTMNQLFGLEENTLSASLTIDQQTLPTMEDYQNEYYPLKIHYRTNAVFALQSRLIELGYLTGENASVDGLYGENTSVAVSLFQARIGVAATGNADAYTQQRMFAPDAPRA